MALLDRVAAVRQPEYTGSNRCLPCTAANLVIGGVATIALGWTIATLGYSPVLSGLVVGIAFALCVLVIYLRGYLVPGTPALTERYLPRRLRRAFGKRTTQAELATADGDVVETLRAAGALESGSDGPVPSEAFSSARECLVEELDEEGANVAFARLLDVSPDDLWARGYRGEFKVVCRGKRAGAWTTERAYRADMAAVRIFEERVPGWDDTDPSQRSELLAGFRTAVDRCPSCDGTLAVVTGTCCGGTDTVTVECADCEQDVLRLRIVG